MLAHKLAKPWAFMTSYGRLDNVHVSENPAILQGIVRNEWGLPDDAIIMSDWSVYFNLLDIMILRRPNIGTGHTAQPKPLWPV